MIGDRARAMVRDVEAVLWLWLFMRWCAAGAPAWWEREDMEAANEWTLVLAREVLKGLARRWPRE